MKKALLSALLAGLPVSAWAQDDPEADARPPSRLSAGVGAAISDSVYAGEGTRVTPFPLVVYQGERFFFHGITAGWRLVETDGFELAAVAAMRFDGFDIGDLGREELARNGLDARLLEDRDDGIDVGLSAAWTGRAGELEVELLADAAGASQGQEVSVEYGYPLQWGRTRVVPAVGLRWMSKDMADYYYGTLDKEVARGVVDYRAGDATVPHIGVSFMRSLGERWSLLATFEYSRFPDAIRSSPFVEPGCEGSVSLMLGIARGF